MALMKTFPMEDPKKLITPNTNLMDPYRQRIKEKIVSTLMPQPQSRDLQPVGPISQAGQIYKQKVTQSLMSPSPLAINSQQQADTNIARRNYQAQKQTQENLAQSPFGVGSQQYQRAMTESRAGAGQANLAEQNQVNEYTRQLTEQNLNRASALEDTEFARALGERSNVQQAESRLGSSIQDPKTKYKYNILVSQGMSPEQAYQQLFESTGTIKEDYRSMNPQQVLQENAREWIKATTGLVEGSQEFNDAVRNRMIATDEARQDPLNDATKQRAIQIAQEKQRKNQALTPEEQDLLLGSGNIPPVTFETVPKGAKNVENFLKDNPSGQVNIGGEIYTIQRGGREVTSYKDKFMVKDRPRHTDYVEVKDPQGNIKYIWGGKINNGKP